MKANAGVWIDHREAVIVVLSDNGEATKRIQSDARKQLRSGEPANGQLHADDLRQREFTEHLSSYYEASVAHLKDAGSILIFGPGEARGELKKCFEKSRAGGVLIVEAADKMTEPQVVARVREHFHAGAGRRGG